MMRRSIVDGRCFRLAMAVACAACLATAIAPACVRAQDDPAGGAAGAARGEAPFPGFPFSPFGDAEGGKFFERFFAPARGEERAALSAIEVTQKEEAALGEAIWRDLRAQFRRERIALTDRGADAQYLRRLVADMAPQMRQSKRYEKLVVLVADSPLTDARAVPGGRLVFHRGMLELAETEAALAGVVAHELSHLDRGHLLTPIQREKLSRQAFSGERGFDMSTMFRAGMSLASAWSRPFRPEDEAEADDDAAIWLHRAGYDARQLAALLQRLHERDKDKPAAMMPGFLRTHPYHADRRRAILDRHADLLREEPVERLYIGAKNLRGRTPRSETEYPDEFVVE